MGLAGVGLYLKGSVEAVELYRRAFGLELGYHVLNSDGSYFHSELMGDGREQFDVVEAEREQAGENPVQLCFEFEHEASLREAFDVLKEGGSVLMQVCRLPWSPCAAEVRDRFGVRWYLTVPQHHPAEDFKPEDMGGTL